MTRKMTDGLRQRKVAGTTTANYLWDDQNIAQESNASLVVQARNTDLPGIWGGKFSQHRGGPSNYYLPDFQGHTRQLADINQAVSDTLILDAWGREIASTGTKENPFKAFGQWGYVRDTASRLWVRARVLDPVIGRWVSREPVGLVDLYIFVLNNPVGQVDPTGLAPCPSPPNDPCDKYPAEPGFWDNSAFSNAVNKALSMCPGYDPAQLGPILHCIVENESRDKPGGYGNGSQGGYGSKPQGPCQIWPGSDKDKTCGKGWNDSFQAHMDCCARLLCECLKSGGGNLVKGCGTKGSGKKRRGTWQVINQSGSGYSPRFKCCLIRHGIPRPSQTISRSGTR